MEINLATKGGDSHRRQSWNMLILTNTITQINAVSKYKVENDKAVSKHKAVSTYKAGIAKCKAAKHKAP